LHHRLAWRQGIIYSEAFGRLLFEHAKNMHAHSFNTTIASAKGSFTDALLIRDVSCTLVPQHRTCIVNSRQMMYVER